MLERRFTLANTAVAVGAYDSLLGAWPLVSMGSFVGVTGLHTYLDVVRLLALAWLSLGLALLALHRKARAVTILGTASTIAGGSLALAEVVFVLLGNIPSIFLIQALAEIIVGMSWMTTLALTARNRQSAA
ncbi:hypothetical protein KF707_12540 [Candidatus Obscuribacterales bacterium]|nr:hypothetical protein [Candidatus Obscuribacterales bacterium]MBX3137062.1 hypothetical protein [Candidatus Obscuribacterales bacterium]MBX3153527.1 hypothetical protein [Candidatus Obscuribacterales bacterium]